MLLRDNPLIYRKSATRVPPRRVGPPPPPPPPPGPLVVDGLSVIGFGEFGGAVLVTFTVPVGQTLVADGADPAKWSARYADTRFAGSVVAVVAYNQLQIDLVAVESDPGDPELVYTNAPSDIGDTLGRELAAFTIGI